MPFTELALPKLKAGPEVKATFAAQWPTSAKLLISHPTIVNAFFGSIIEENGLRTAENENRPIIIIEWTEEAAFNSFLASEAFATFVGPIKPLAVAPAELQLFETDGGPLEVASTPLMEIIRIQPQQGVDSGAITKDAWASFIEELSGTTPVTSGPSLNVETKLFMGTIGWQSLEARADILNTSQVQTVLSNLREAGQFSSILVEVEPFKVE